MAPASRCEHAAPTELIGIDGRWTINTALLRSFIGDACLVYLNVLLFVVALQWAKPDVAVTDWIEMVLQADRALDGVAGDLDVVVHQHAVGDMSRR